MIITARARAGPGSFQAVECGTFSRKPEQEQGQHRDRQRRGVKFGRKPSLTREQINPARKLIDNGEARQYVADLLNLSRSTLYRALGS